MTLREHNRRSIDNDIVRGYLRERAQWWNELRESEGKLQMTFEQVRVCMLRAARSNVTLRERVRDADSQREELRALVYQIIDEEAGRMAWPGNRNIDLMRPWHGRAIL